ncbi:MAG TPA: mechanosensitive ion channel domain-containing protein [Polyangia bacterium]|nr:mechanosensitive ion channel domain-containing protein [Polyangia bacterium]
MPDIKETGGLMDVFDPSALPYAAAWILGAFLLMRFGHRLLSRLSERIPRYRLKIKQFDTLFSFIVYLSAFALAFSSLFTLSSEALFALSGTIAVTVGFALKDVAASFMAGISILVSKPFQVGDRVTFGGFYGEVVEIGLRTVRLVTLDDNLVTIPNNKFLTEAVASANAGALDCMVVMKYWVTPSADISRAVGIVRDAVLASKYLYLGKPVTVLIASELVEEGRVVVELTAKAYVFDARHEKAFSTDVTDRVLRAFAQNHIQMPGYEPRPAEERTRSVADQS